MRFLSRHALLVVAPLAIYASGCASTLNVSRATRGTAATPNRLLTMARVHEAKGQYQSAYKLYTEVLKAEPSNAFAREHSENMMLAMRNEVGPPTKAPTTRTIPGVNPDGPGSPKEPELMLASASSKPRLLSDEEVAARLPKNKKRTATASRIEMASATEAPKKHKYVDEEFIDLDSLDTEAMLPKVTAAPGKLVIERPVAIVEGAPDPLPSIEPAETVMEVSTVESAESHILITEAATADSESSGWKKTSFGDLCPEASDELLTEIDRLNGTDSNARVAALESLGSRAAEAKAALPAIHACLSDESESVRVHAACALWTITSSPSETVPALETVLGGADPDSVALACYLLGEIGDEASPAIQTLAGLQNHTCVEVRIHAAEALLKITGGGSGSAIVLTNSLADCDEQERCLVAVALGSAKGEDRNVAIETLITCLEDPQPSVRAASALSLGGFGPYASKAARPLQQAATSDDAEIRQAAETALACIKK